MWQVQPEHLGVGVGGNPAGSPHTREASLRRGPAARATPGLQSCAAELGVFRTLWELTKKYSSFWGPRSHQAAPLSIKSSPSGALGPKDWVGAVIRASAPFFPAFARWLVGTEHGAL